MRDIEIPGAELFNILGFYSMTTEDIMDADGNDYYGAGYSDGEYDYENGNNYNDGLFDNDEYARGYADGWDNAEAKKEEEEDE